MRATMRITWLLLSLSFLFHSVCSNDVTTQPMPVSATTSGSEITTHSTVQADKTTGATPTDDGGQKNTTILTPAQTIITVTTKMPTATTLADITQSQIPIVKDITQSQIPIVKDITQSQIPIVKNNVPTAPPAVTVNTITVAANPSTPNATVPAATSGSSSPTNPATTHTPEISSPSKTSRTEPSLTTGSVVTTKISADDSTAQQSMTSITFKPSLTDGAAAVTGTSPSHKQTASNTPEPIGNAGAPSTPSTQTRAGLPAAANTTDETTSSQTTINTTTITATTITTTTTTTTTTPATAPQPKTFSYSLNNGHEKGDEKHLVEVCRRLMGNYQDGNCTLTWRMTNGKVQFDYVEINGKVKTALAAQYYEEITKTPTDNKTLIAILSSCGALLIMIVILAVCASHHRKPYNENQQHLTEELHTVENGYHDNPTLEVMEVQPEMQEKKVALNGEFNDSWIVPIDNLLKEDIPDEEDTHL